MERKPVAIDDGVRWGAVATRVGDTHVAVVILDASTPTSPIPVQVTIQPGTRVTRRLVQDALDAWMPPNSPTPITSATLRGVGLGDLAAAWVAENVDKPDTSALDAVSTTSADIATAIDGLLAFDWPPGGILGYRRRVDLRSAITKAIAAQLYGKATAEGDHAPTLVVARHLHLDPTPARDLVARARRDGFLAGGTQGRPGGTATTKALTLIGDLAAYRKDLNT